MEYFTKQGYNYIVHHTSKINWKNIKKTEWFYSEYDRYKLNIESSGLYSITSFNFKKPWKIQHGQFPGIYCSIINNLDDLKEQIEMSSNDILLFFRLEMLNQKNWHFNLFDRNGTFGYDTFTYENAEDLPPYQDVKNFYMEKLNKYFNEIVFHDSISIKNVDFIYDGHNIIKMNSSLHLCDKIGGFLYYSDLYYTGLNVPFYSKPESIKTTDIFYREYCKKYLGTYRGIIKDCSNKMVIENLILGEKVGGVDLFTYLFLNR